MRHEAPRGASRLHFLHIPKTGGTAIIAALAPHAAARGIVLHPHATTMRDIPEGERVFFVLRDPLTRFVSSFNSRLRQGRPRYDVPWTPDEAAAFARFPTPDALAAALSDPAQETRAAAALAMRRIAFVSAPLRHWLFSQDLLSRRRADIIAVLHQERLDEDFAALLTRLALPAGLSLPADPVESHRVPSGFVTALGPIAQANLRRWYAADMALDAWCRRLLSTRDGNAATPRG